MKKTPKSYRLSPRAIRALDRLHFILPGWSETDIIEAAVECLLASETTSIQIQQMSHEIESSFKEGGRPFFGTEEKDDLAEAYDLPY